MTIQFSPQEVVEIRCYFDKVKSGETQSQLHASPEEFPEWNRIFLLLRKLLAYAIYNGVKTGEGISYKELQRRTQKSRDMLVNVHTCFDKFENLLAAYTASLV